MRPSAKSNSFLIADSAVPVSEPSRERDVEEAEGVPGVRLLSAPARELHDPALEGAVADLLREQYLAAAELLRPPEQVVPEFVRELVKLGLGRRQRTSQRSFRRLDLDPVVVEHAKAAREDLRRCRRQIRQGGCG